VICTGTVGHGTPFGPLTVAVTACGCPSYGYLADCGASVISSVALPTIIVSVRVAAVKFAVPANVAETG
jgi:hypothetical protein